MTEDVQRILIFDAGKNDVMPVKIKKSSNIQMFFFKDNNHNASGLPA